MEVCYSTEMVPQVQGPRRQVFVVGVEAPRIWERETTDPKPTEADHDQSRVDFRKTVLWETSTSVPFSAPCQLATNRQFAFPAVQAWKCALA